MDNAVPFVLVRRWLVGSIAAIAEGVRHGVEDMPQKSFGKNKAVCASVNNDHGIQELRRNLYRCVWYQAIRSHKSP